MSEIGKAVFLSYASQDSDAARRIAQALRAEGVEVWFDESELRGGESWDASIQRQIAECALFVAVVSSHTQARREGYFRLEWRLADERMRLMAEGTPFVLPVIVDATKEREALVPKSFLGVQWTWLPHGEVPPAWVVRVKKLLGGEAIRGESLGRPAEVAPAVVDSSDLPPPQPVKTEASGTTRRVPWLQMLPWTLAAGASLVAAWLFHRGDTVPAGEPLSPVVARATIVLPADAPLANPQDQPMGVTFPSIAISPDGRRLVYVAAITKTSGTKKERSTQLYIRELHESSARPISETVGGYFPFFSPDGRWVGYFADGKLFKVAIQGGAPVLLGDAGKEINGADWSEDGTISFVDNPRLYRISERGGVRELWESNSGAAAASVFSHFVLPGSDNVIGAFYHRQSISGDFSPISVFSPSTNKSKVVVNRGYHARFLPPGFLVFARERGLHAAVFDPTALKLIGEPMAVVDGVMLNAVEKAAQYAVSCNGTLVYALGGLLHRATPAWLDRKGGLQKLPMEARTYGHMSISPDGSRFAILVPDVTQNIWVFDSATGRGGPLSEPGVQVSCVWTTDSSRLIIASERNGRCGLYLKNPDHASVPAETLYEFEDEKEMLWPHSVAPDGKNLIGLRTRGGVRAGFVLPLDGSRKLGKIVVPEDAWFLQFSPDGQWFSFWSGKSGRGDVYVQRFPTGELIQVSFGGGEEARWSAKGDELYFRNGAVWMAVPVTTTPSFKAGEPREIFRGPYINVPGFSYDVTPDGQRFMVLQPEDLQEKPITELQVIFNWTEELKRRLPAGVEKGR